MSTKYILSYLKSFGPNYLFEATDIENSSFLLTISAERQIRTLHYICSVLKVIMDQSLDKVIFHTICYWANKMLQTNQTKPVNCLMSYFVQLNVAIYAYLAQRSEIVTEGFTEFFIT